MTIRVLIADDSAFARKVLRECLATDPELEIVDIARDGLEALERIAEHRPDVVTLDLSMPNLDGAGVLAALPPGGPRVVVVSASSEESEPAMAALAAGAVELVHKPTALATGRLYEIAAPLVRAVKNAAAARPGAPRAPAVAVTPGAYAGAADVVVLATSTGGPQAIAALVSSLPVDLPVPVVIALHIPAGYTDALARRLDRNGRVRVREAGDGDLLRAGEVLLAPGGRHAVLRREPAGVVVSLRDDPAQLYTPSGDLLFGSAAAIYGARTLGVVLTGMGSDALEGARAIVAGGGRVLAESEATALIYGMPRCIADAGLADALVPLDQMVAAILRRL